MATTGSEDFARLGNVSLKKKKGARRLPGALFFGGESLTKIVWWLVAAAVVNLISSGLVVWGALVNRQTTRTLESIIKGARRALGERWGEM